MGVICVGVCVMNRCIFLVLRRIAALQDTPMEMITAISVGWKTWLVNHLWILDVVISSTTSVSSNELLKAFQLRTFHLATLSVLFVTNGLTTHESRWERCLLSTSLCDDKESSAWRLRACWMTLPCRREENSTDETRIMQFTKWPFTSVIAAFVPSMAG